METQLVQFWYAASANQTEEHFREFLW